MKKIVVVLIIVFGFIISSCSNKRDGVAKVLVFSKTSGYKHKSIPAGIAAINKLGLESGFDVDTTKNADLFTDDNLKNYSAIIFLSTTGNVLNNKQEAAFERYIQAGGGYVGIHAATDTEYDWGWYTKLAGAQFLSHPRGTPEADFIVKDKNFIANKHLKDTIWHRTDELYNYKNMNPDVNVLLTLDESSYKGGENGDFHPIAWYHDYDGGRAFYTGGGHTAESFEEPDFLKHILGGIQYAIGKNENLDYSKSTTQIPPDADRFSKVTLKEGDFFEPTEMTVLPNNDVLVAERRGGIKLYKDATKELIDVATLDVYHKTLNTPKVNAEEGVLGLQKDPNYATNNWIYVYYSPTGDAWVNRLSRFKFKDDVFDMASEQVILDVNSDREICCHTGGSIAFDANGLLYLSTGDNTTPFNEKNVEYVSSGYAPLNDIPGHEQYDARRSSGNTNDLRGKILRIKVNEDGSYSIPEGNLFAEGTEKTKPEIYTMGHRNPYRISIDPKKGYLYWGEVGPDSRKDDFKNRGPKGYDEFGQAQKAGNFGWPLFIANNIPYVDYDYETGESGITFNPSKPVNDSRNNTGLKILPEAMPAFVYYPYAKSGDFPQLGTGGRNAMAGPTYYSDLYPNGGGLPKYYDGKVIVFDWVRGWMMAITNFEDGSFNKMEPFAPHVEINSAMDMELGPNGRLYILEYGSGWYSHNLNSSLGYIAYNAGNRPPVIENVTVNKNSGTIPLTVTAKAKAIDRDGDSITFLWDLGNGETKETTEPEITYTYNNIGEYNVALDVKDDKGGITHTNLSSIVAGNSTPVVNIDLLDGNTSTFTSGKPIKYKVTVTDPDGNTDINPDNIFVSVDYLEGLDEANVALGHQEVSAEITGKALTQAMDCKACHKEKEASIGPSYLAVAQKYKRQKKIIPYLQNKIVNGGGGVWGEVMMPIHPSISSDETRQIATYIMSLVKNSGDKKSLPQEGSITPSTSKDDNVLVLKASYTDNGLNGVRPLVGATSVRLKREK
ncbi:ThuA domain-containing protein [Algibacter sp. AS12]|uniref:ThuA domain-containing protein n=1 Tax=Algibacter sp. AS12 TaxID=3135773 RepID=UPI00398BBC39